MRGKITHFKKLDLLIGNVELKMSPSLVSTVFAQPKLRVMV